MSGEQEGLDQVTEGANATGFDLVADRTYPQPRFFDRVVTGCRKSTLPFEQYQKMYTRFGFSENEVRFPRKGEMADCPPSGYVAVNYQMLCSGAIPPFNPYLESVLKHLAIAPYQLHPSGYQVLLSLYILFMKVRQQAPTFADVCSLYSFKRREVDGPLFFFLDNVHDRIITGLTEGAKGFPHQYFFVRCPSKFFGRWAEGGNYSFTLGIFTSFLLLI